MNEKRKLQILLVDDETHIRMMLKMVMKSMGAEIAGEAKNGAEAVELFRKIQPNITLLDINMPVKTGEDALKLIIEEFPNACIIMMTSLADSETVQNCIEAGAAGYILKDTPIDEMKQIIKDVWSECKNNKN